VPKRPNGQSKGIAFVEFATHKDAKKALDKENGKDFDGRALKINFSGEAPAPREGGFNNNAGGGASSTIFVGNLGFKTTE
jgi:nucleolin